MDHRAQIDRGWLALRHRHEVECHAHKTEFDQKLAVLLRKHAQEEEEYLSSKNQKVPSNRTQPEPKAPRLGAQAAQPTDMRAGSTKPTLPMNQGLPPKVSSLIEMFDEQKHGSRPNTLMTKQRLSQLPSTQQARPPDLANSAKGVHLLPETRQTVDAAADSHADSVPMKDGSYIDLCSSDDDDDDDVIVEIPRTAFEQRTAPKSHPDQIFPSVPSASFELFGTQHSNPALPAIKPDNPETARKSQQGLDLLSSNKLAPSPCQPGKLSDGGDAASVMEKSAMRQQKQQTGIFVTPIFPPELIERPGSGPRGLEENRNSDGDTSPEDLPLVASFDTPKTMKKLGPLSDKQENAIPGPVIELLALKAKTDPELKVVMKIVAAERASPRQLVYFQNKVKEMTEQLRSRNEEFMASMPPPPVHMKQQAADSSTSVSTNHPTKIVDVKNPQSYSALPSIASSPAVVDEAKSLLSSFKKSLQPPTPGRSPSTANSRASSSTLAPGSTTGYDQPVYQGGSVASRNSSASTLSTSGKRRAINLSDDDDSDYSPSAVSAVPARKGSGDFLGSPIKKARTAISSQAKPRVQPHSRPPHNPAKRKTSATSPKKAASTTPATPPRASRTWSKNMTPITPKLYSGNLKASAPSTPYHKRTAAIQAESEIQKTSEVDELLHSEDKIYRASVKETRRKGRGSPGLGARLRSMSITPIPMGTSGDPPHPGPPGLQNARGQISSQETMRAVDDDSDEDLDISNFTFANGIIVQSGQERRHTEMQTKSDRRRSRNE
ncbi:hypothetical protein E8E13_008829 [Curvularia kusanoi]|uniref:Uncharacterized protein n=1 Tax=Curvularia kusanoi TaxID=90978 RepID=A0A9P4TMH6_CURKU|nr:hypothetical protein E8E13_008829 [Curvularia kusanoi]